MMSCSPYVKFDGKRKIAPRVCTVVSATPGDIELGDKLKQVLVNSSPAYGKAFVGIHNVTYEHL